MFGAIKRLEISLVKKYGAIVLPALLQRYMIECGLSHAEMNAAAQLGISASQHLADLWLNTASSTKVITTFHKTNKNVIPRTAVPLGESVKLVCSTCEDDRGATIDHAPYMTGVDMVFQSSVTVAGRFIARIMRHCWVCKEENCLYIPADKREYISLNSIANWTTRCRKQCLQASELHPIDTT